MAPKTKPTKPRARRRRPTMRTLDLAALTAGLVAWFDQTRDSVKDSPMEWTAAMVFDALAPQVAELARAAKPYGGRA